MSSSNSPCAACKFLRRKCTQECALAPYFPPDQPHKFANVHKVFGKSNVEKLLNELNATQREEAVNSLAYEAQMRLNDPVYGCVGLISILQHRLKQVQTDLINAKKELVNYIGPSAMLPILPGPYMQQQQQHPGNPSSSAVIPYNMQPMMYNTNVPTHGGALVMAEPQQHQHQHQPQLFEAQQLAATMAAREQQEMFRTYEQQQQQQQQHPQHQQELVGFNSGFDAEDLVTPTGFNQMTAATPMSPSLALGTFDNSYQISHQPEHHQLQPQLLIQQSTPPRPQQPSQQQQQQHQRSGSHEEIS